MFKYILLIILGWVLFRIIRTIAVVSRVTRTYRIKHDEPVETAEAQKSTKLISPEEGEYVDFEEIKADKNDSN
jgi:hypothetical protein